MSRKDLTNGTKVLFGSIPATVISTARNGVRIGYWGMGLKADQWIEKRVSATYLRPIEKAA